MKFKFQKKLEGKLICLIVQWGKRFTYPAVQGHNSTETEHTLIVPIFNFEARWILKSMLKPKHVRKWDKPALRAQMELFVQNRDKVCYEKLMERLKSAHHIRDARIKKYKKALRRGWKPNRRHVGAIIDISNFDSRVEARANWCEFENQDFVFIP